MSSPRRGFWRRRRPAIDTAPTAVRRTDVVEEDAPPPPPPARPDLWPWLLLLLLLVLGGLGAVWYLSRDDDEREPRDTVAATTREREPVPNVLGLQRERAVELLERDGFEAKVTRRPSNRTRDEVIDQNPNAGNVVDEGSTISVGVSAGPPRGTVPDVTGLREADARERVENADFRVTVARTFAEQRRGLVVAQRPEGGTVQKEKSVVALTISRGPRPVDVPNVVGETASDAGSILRRAGLEVAVAEVPSGEPAGAVVAQNPSGGERAPRGSRVRINVSTGEGAATTTAPTTTAATTTAATTTQQTTTAATRVAVPRVIGQTVQQARRTLGLSKLNARVVYVASTQPRNRVVGQNPRAGTSVARGTIVRLNVSRGPAQPQGTVPDVVGLDEQLARQELTTAGFTVRVERQPTDDPTLEGVVLEQQPPGGMTAPAGSEVTIVVADAP